MKDYVERDIKPYHPHLCDLAQQVSRHGAGKILNGHVVICKAVDGMAPRRNGFAVGSVGIWGISHFAWLPDMVTARSYAASLCVFLYRSAKPAWKV